jgi:hypothetical protein
VKEMNIYRNKEINIFLRPTSRFPRVSKKIAENLWLTKGRNGQELLESMLNLIGDYDFDRRYLREIDNRTFELKTRAGKIIKVKLVYGNLDDCPQIIVTEDNVEMSYDYVPISSNNDLLYFDTTEQKDVETGFIQYFNGEYDKVSMSNDGVSTILRFYNPNVPETYDERKGSTFLVSDRLKEAVKRTIKLDTVELYNSIASNLDENVNGFDILRYDEKTRKTIDEIKVSDGRIAYILLTKKYANGSVALEEDNREEKRFSANIDNVDIDYAETLSEFNSLKTNLEMKLRKEL